MSTDVPRETEQHVATADQRRGGRNRSRQPRPERSGSRVSFPWHSRPEESMLGRLATPMTGKNCRTATLPEVNDEVLVAFERGDIRFPFVVGALWNGDASHR